jgi:myo-inositol-1(or 4)-monophosphatase
MTTGAPIDAALIAQLRELAAAIAVDAGALVRSGRTGEVGGIESKSSATDMVTEFDRASERLIVDRLHRARPDDTIVGEEGTDHTGSSGVSWLVDPIDGTTNFLYDLPGYAVSIAAADALGPVAGAVYVPASGELFSAGRGQGATLDGRPIRCSDRTEIAHALVGTGFSYLPERRTRQARRVAALIHRVRDIRRLGAASVDLCFVAAGRLDAYFEEWLGPWDLAAGELIAREAGCRSGDFTGGPARPDQILVATPGVWASLAALIEDADRTLADT